MSYHCCQWYECLTNDLPTLRMSYQYFKEFVANTCQWWWTLSDSLPMLTNACKCVFFFQSANKNVLQMCCQYLPKCCEYEWNSPQGGVITRARGGGKKKTNTRTKKRKKKKIMLGKLLVITRTDVASVSLLQPHGDFQGERSWGVQELYQIAAWNVWWTFGSHQGPDCEARHHIPWRLRTWLGVSCDT